MEQAEKVATPECQLFIAAHYAQSNIDTLAEDWELEKKYKNFHGFTCRDFFNKNLGLHAVVVAELKEDKYELSVLENASYKTFLDEMARKPLFYYVPIVSNNGLVFFFEKTMTFDATSHLENPRKKQIPYLIKKLQALFKEDEYVIFEPEHHIAFPKHNIDNLIQVLERNGLQYNEKLFNLIDKTQGYPYELNVILSLYDFPEDKNLNSEKTIEKIFSIVSKEKKLMNEDYSRIRKLFQAISLEEIDNIKTIAMGFRPDNDRILEAIIKDVETEKNNELLWKKL